MGLSQHYRHEPGAETVLAFHIRQAFIEVNRIHLAALLRVFQSILGLILFCVLGTAEYHYLTDVNKAFDIEAFVSLIIAALAFWFYGFFVVALEIQAVVSKLPSLVQSFLQKHFYLVQCLGDLGFAILLFALGVRTFRAIHAPVCGGIFMKDFCYTVPDVCVMRGIGNASLRGFHCPLSKLQSGCAFAFITSSLAVWSSYVALRLHAGRSRLLALGGDEDGLSASLMEKGSSARTSGGGRSMDSKVTLEVLDSMAEEGKQERQ